MSLGVSQGGNSQLGSNIDSSGPSEDSSNIVRERRKSNAAELTALKDIKTSKTDNFKYFPSFRTSYVQSKQFSCLAVVKYRDLIWLITGCTGGHLFLQEVVDNCHLLGPSYLLKDVENDSVKKKRHTGRITAVSSFILNDDVYIVSSSMDRSVIVWKLPKQFTDSIQPSLHCKVNLLVKSTEAVTSVAVYLLKTCSGDKPIIATAGRDNQLCLWDFSNTAGHYYCNVLNYASGDTIKRLAHEDWISGVIMYSPEVFEKSLDPRINVPPLVIVTCSMDRTVRAWTVAIDDKNVRNPGTADHVLQSSLSGRTVDQSYERLANDDDQESIVDNWRFCVVGRHHNSGVYCITYHERQDPLIITGDHDGVILLWSINATKKKIYKEAYEDADLEMEGKEFIQMIPLRKLDGHNVGINGLTVINCAHGMNSMLVSASVDKSLKVWNLEAGEIIRTLEGHKASVAGVVVLPYVPNIKDADEVLFQPVLVSAEYNGWELLVWNFQAREEIHNKSFCTRLEGHLKAITCCKFYWSERSSEPYLISASKDKSVRIYGNNGKISSFTESAKKEEGSAVSAHKDEVTAIEIYYAPNGNVFCITAGADKYIKLWKLNDIDSTLIFKVSIRSAVTCLTILCPSPDSNVSEPIVVAGCLDRSICMFSLDKLPSDKDFRLRPQRGHEGSVFQVVALNGNKKKDARIVSSSVNGEIIVWHWPLNGKVMSRYHVPLSLKGKVFLSVCTVAKRLPFVAFADNSHNFIGTLDPWNELGNEPKFRFCELADKEVLAVDHTFRSRSFRSKITAMASFTPDKTSKIGIAPAILVGHEDGSTTRYNSFTKSQILVGNDDGNTSQYSLFSNFNEENEDGDVGDVSAWVDDGNSFNEVQCLVSDMGGSYIATGFGNSLIKIKDKTEKITVLEARDAFVNSFLAFNLYNRNMVDYATHLIAACNDKCLRMITISDNHEVNDVILLENVEAKLLDFVFTETPTIVGYVAVGAVNDFYIHKIDRENPSRICQSKELCQKVDVASLSCLKFFDYSGFHKSSDDRSPISEVLPFIVTADKEGVSVWKWMKSTNYAVGHIIEQSDRFLAIDFYGPDLPKPKKIVQLKNLEGESSRMEEIDACPVFCVDVCAKYSLIVVGSLLGYPLLLDCSNISENRQNKMKLSQKPRQFKPDKGIEGSCHKDCITCVSICIRNLETKTAIEIITGSKDQSIIMWDYVKRKKMWGPVVASAEGAVKTISVFDPIARGFSRTGTPVIVVTGGDNIVRIFNYRGELLREMDVHEKPLLGAEIVVTKTFPMLVTTAIDNSLKYTDAYFILTNTFPTHASVKAAFNRDRRDFITKNSNDKKWHRIHSLCSLAGGGQKLFAENAKLFMDYMIDRDEFNFMETFIRSCPEVVLIPQCGNVLRVRNLSWRKTFAEVNDISERKELHKQYIDKIEKLDNCMTMLFVAMKLNNKDDVEDIVSALLVLVNRPLKDLYDQFYPVGAHIAKRDLTELAVKFPLDFLRLIKGTKMQRAIMVSKERMTRHMKRGSYELRGVTFNFELTNLWTPIPNKNHWKVFWEKSQKVRHVIDFFGEIVYDESFETEQWVTPMVIMIPELATFEMLNAYILACKTLDDVTLFDSDVGRCALSFSWRNFGEDNHFVDFGKHMLYCLVFSLSLFMFERSTGSVTLHSTHFLLSRCVFAWVLQALSIIGAFYFLGVELIQFQLEFKCHFRKYICDMWNVNDLMLHFTLLTGTLLRCGYTVETNASRNVLSVCAIFMYFKILYYLRAYKLTGPLVAMIFQIVHDIIPFCLVLFIVLFGFSHSFWIISLQNIALPFGTIQSALLNSYDYMLGGFSSDYSGTTSPALGAFLYVCFMLIVALLLLNLLIALMGDSFSNVKGRGLAQWRMEATSIISDQVQWMPAMVDPVKERSLTQYYPKIVHVLRLTSDLERECSAEQQITDLADKLSSLETRLEGKLDRITKAMAESNIFELSDDGEDLLEKEEAEMEEEEDIRFYGSDSELIEEEYFEEEVIETDARPFYAVDVPEHEHTLCHSLSDGWSCASASDSKCSGVNFMHHYTCSGCDFDYCHGCATKYATRVYQMDGTVTDFENGVPIVDDSKEKQEEEEDVTVIHQAL